MAAGAAQVTVAWPLPCTTEDGASGVPGTPTTMLGDALDGAEVPRTCDVTTVHVYALPLVMLDTVIGELEPDAVPVTPPFDEVQVAWKVTFGSPPLDPGVKLTVAAPLPGAAVTAVAGDGGADGRTMFEIAEVGP